MGTPSCPSKGGTPERESAGAEIAGEQKKKAKDAKRIRGIAHDNDKSKGTSHVQDEMEKTLMHHGEQELLSLWDGWHWDDNKKQVA